MVLLVTGEVEMNLGPPAEQMKTSEVLVYVKSQEKRRKVIKGVQESHKQEMSGIREGTNALGSKSDQLSEVIKKVIRHYNQLRRQ